MKIINSKYAIKVGNLSKNYGNVTALNSISFEVKKGEIFGIIGPDGAGKSTLFRILTTLLLSDSGKAELFGNDVVEKYKEIRKSIGYMPGKFSLYQDLSVEENLKFFASVFRTTIKENYYLIEPIYKQIEPFKKRRAGDLSGGMKQKLALCCALIHKPQILFLDEPTTGVDAVSRKEFWDMLDFLKKNGLTILVSTPYMDEASRCDEVALIYGGNILTVKSPQEIVASHSEKVLSIKSEKRYELICDLREFYDAKYVFTFGDSLHFTSKSNRFDEKYFKEITEYLTVKNHHNIQIEPAKITIEDSFMSLMQQSDEIRKAGEK
jgi:ABC-type multidrug transport system ATPase subunit